MRKLMTFGAAALFAVYSLPAFAQSCCDKQEQQTQAEQSTGKMCGSMCGGMKAESAAPAQGEQAQKSGCPCCQNMAMMQPKADAMPNMSKPEAPKVNP